MLANLVEEAPNLPTAGADLARFFDQKEAMRYEADTLFRSECCLEVGSWILQIGTPNFGFSVQQRGLEGTWNGNPI